MTIPAIYSFSVQADISSLELILSDLYADQERSNFLSKLASLYSNINFRTGSDFYADFAWGGTSAEIVYQSSLTPTPYLDTAGTRHYFDLGRIVFHELAHLALQAPTYDTNYVNANDGTYRTAMYREELAIFVENALYAVPHGQPERVGHGANLQSGFSTPSASSVQYLAGLVYVSSDTDPDYNTTFTFSSGQATISKTYHSIEHQVLASSAIRYDHYITVSFSDLSGVFNDAANIRSQNLASLISNGALAVDPSVGIGHADTSIYAAAAAAMLLRDGEVSQALQAYSLDQNSAIVVSAERFFDAIGNNGQAVAHVDQSGPTEARSAPMTHLQIKNDSAVGTALFGGGGFTSYGIDARNVLDVLHGGDGDDALFAGFGVLTGDANVLEGGSGDDILVGNRADDRLLGGDGHDLLIGSEGNDVYDGGNGVDTLSYASSVFGVEIDIPSSKAHLQSGAVSTSGLGQTFSNIEVFIGSDFDDIFKGEGAGAVFVGGEGDDTFYLYSGDTAIGGAGADKFYLSSKLVRPGETVGTPDAGFNTVTLAGLDVDDEIYIDGIRYHGSSISVTAGSMYPETDESGPLWKFHVNSTSRFASDYDLWRTGSSADATVRYFGEPEDLDRFEWEISNGALTSNAYVTIVESTPVFDEYGEWDRWGQVETIESQIFIELPDFDYGSAGLQYSWFNQGYHSYSDFDAFDEVPGHFFDVGQGYDPTPIVIDASNPQAYMEQFSGYPLM